MIPPVAVPSIERSHIVVISEKNGWHHDVRLSSGKYE